MGAKMNAICAHILIFAAFIWFEVTEIKGDQVEPSVAYVCGRPAKHVTSHGWASDNATDCLILPDDILEHCKKSYPNLDVRNIVEYNEEVTVQNWCDYFGKNCDFNFTVRPFQCLVGAFVVKEVHVPQGCILDRMFNTLECKSSRDWKSLVFHSCGSRGMDSSMSAVFHPCDIGRFSGVHFVCCSLRKVSVEVINNWPAVVGESNYSVVSERQSEVAGDDKSQPTDAKPPENEHERFMQIKSSLLKKHDGGIEKIMDAWEEAHFEVERLRARDLKMAEKLEKKIIARFQKTINALEEKEHSDKRWVESEHEQLVQAELNTKKLEAMEAYLDLLNKEKEPATFQEVYQALKHYIRMEEKDRMHVINLYQHLLKSDPAVAEASYTLVVEHLRTISLRIKGAVQMLNRVPEYEAKILNKIKDIEEEYRSFDKLESVIFQDFTTEAQAARVSTEKSGEKEQKENEEIQSKSVGGDGDYAEEEAKVRPAIHQDLFSSNELHLEEHLSLRMRHDSSLSIGPLVLVIAIGIFLVTVTIFGFLIWRRKVMRRRCRQPMENHLLASREQFHVTNMQLNGYENPTYKYFETRVST